MLKKIIAGLLIYTLAVTQVVAQTAALVPNAKQTFLGTTGAPLSAGTVTMYTPNSTNKKTTWVDPNQASTNTNPIVLDAAGRGIIFGQGNYRQVVKDKNGVQIWDSFTSASGSSAPSGATGTDTAPVGSVMAFSGFVVPTNWALSYGQPLVRVTYPDLLTAITISNNAITCTASSVTLTGFVSTAQIRLGAPIEATCLPSNTTIATIAGPTSVTVNNAAVSSGVVTAVVFPWGNGDGVSTFNVPDLRGRVLPGADAMGGTAASRLTTATNANGWNRPGSGGGVETQTLTTPNLPAYTPSGAVGLGSLSATTPVKVFNVATIGGPGLSVFDINAGGGQSDSLPVVLSGTPTFTGVAQGGIGTPISVVQPSITVNYIIKVAPNTSGAGGVVSIGGMFGDIICAATLTCANQIIGVALSSLDGTYFSNTPAATIFGNPTSISTQPINFTINGLVNKASPLVNADRILLWDSVSGSFRYVTPGQIATSATSGVSTLNSLAGALNLIAGSGVSVTPAGSSITIANTGATTVSNSDSSLTISPTTGAVVASLNVGHINTWSARQNFGSQATFSGKPFVDVQSGANGCAAAIGAGTDDTAAIQCQINYMNTTYAAGIVFVPCGNYRIVSTITVPGAVKLIGGGVSCSFITANNGSPIALNPMFDFTGSNGGMERIFVLNNNNLGSSGITVIVEATAVASVFRDCTIRGGNVGLKTSGTDGLYENCYISAGTNGSASVYLHGTTSPGSNANWFIRDKIDDASSTVQFGVLIDTVSGANSVMENHFTQCDFSGYTTASMRIDDSTNVGTRTAITVVDSSVFSLPIQIISHKLTSFVGNELGSNIAITAGAGNVAVTGNLGLSAVTATGASCAGNVNVTC